MTGLRVEGLQAFHGLLPAVRNVSLTLAPGEIVALVGANGAGKTTLLRTLCGAHRAARGAIYLDDLDLTPLPACRRLAHGIALVPEGRRLFAGMTVEENLKLGASAKRPGAWDLERVRQALPQLIPLWKKKASALSGGQQQAVAIGRALMANPRVLLLDELSLGLSPKAVEGVYASLETLRAAQVSMLLVEQDLQRSLSFAERVICMLEGRVVAEGRCDAMSREEVMGHYFGRGASRADLEPQP